MPREASHCCSSSGGRPEGFQCSCCPDLTNSDPTAARRQEYVGKEVRELERGITHLRNNMARYNALTAENLALKHQLREDNRNLEFNISIELKVGSCALLPGQVGCLTAVCGPGRRGACQSC